MSRRPLRLRARRGAAAVEMAISMLVIIPVFMYALFLDDLLRYSLDAQEAALSTVWDFTVQDYTKDLATAPTSATGPAGGRTAVQKQARLMFCDHESGKDRYTAMTNGNYSDCEDTNHHQGLVGHVCWINDNAKQVTCEEPERGVGALGVPIHGDYMSTFTHGGLIRCSAKAVVENYLIPENFLQEFSKEKLSKENWRGAGGDIHSNAEQGTDETAYYLAEQKLAILTDTWALTNDANTLPGNKSGEMYDRVANVYQNPVNVGHPLVMAMSAVFFGQAVSNNLLSPYPFAMLAFSNGDQGGADNPKTPNLAIVPHTQGMQTPSNTVKQEGQNRRYFNTEWRDWDKDNNRKTYEHQARGRWYMGCKNPGSC